VTSAKARGWWLPPLPDALSVFASMGLGDPRPLRQGIRTVRLARPAPFDVIGGIRVASVIETLLACARDLCLLDLVVLIDGALFAGDAKLDELRAAAAGLPRRKGVPALRAALELADDRSESAWETLLRLLHVLCGVDVEPQHEVRGAHGELVARGDLWLVGTKVLHEYDGGDHLERPRQRKDLRRSRRLDREDWVRRGFTCDDVIHRAVTILRDAERAIGRPHEPERIRPWNELLRQSLFTPAGTQKFLSRLGVSRAA
jgi:very-short-patch-repair endonuclease